MYLFKRDSASLCKYVRVSQTASQAKAIEKTFNTTSHNEQESCSNNIRGCSFLSKHSAGDQIHYFSPIKRKSLFPFRI